MDQSVNGTILYVGSEQKKRTENRTMNKILRKAPWLLALPLVLVLLSLGIMGNGTAHADENGDIFDPEVNCDDYGSNGGSVVDCEEQKAAIRSLEPRGEGDAGGRVGVNGRPINYSCVNWEKGLFGLVGGFASGGAPGGAAAYAKWLYDINRCS